MMNISQFKGRVLLALALCLSIILSLAPAPTLRAEDLVENLDPAQISQGNLQDFDIAGTAYYEEARQLVDMVNELRTSLGLQALAFNMQLEDLALLRAAETSLYWSHMRPDGSYLYETNRDVAGENIQSSIARPATVFQAWLNSPGHYENMVNPEYKSIGIGAYASNHGEPPRWWAQVFSRTLEETTKPDRQNGASVVQRIRVNPDFLAMKILSGPQIDTSLTSPDFGQKANLRLQVGDQVPLYGMVHYKLSGANDWPGSVPPEALVWENSSPSVVKLEAGGILTAQALGEATIRVSHRDLPELTTSLQVEVLPINRFRLNSYFNPEKSELLFQEVQANYLAKPPVESYVGESSPEANRIKEMSYRFYEQIGITPVLQEFALALAKQYSLFLLPDSLESLPEIGRIFENLPGQQRMSLQAFSDLDAPEDQMLLVPGWARSAAAIVLETGGHNLRLLLYSDLAPTAMEQDWGDFFAPETLALSSQNPFGLTYEVDLFADRDDFNLAFADQYQILSQLDFLNPQAANLSYNEQGQLVYRPQLLLVPSIPGPFLPAEPDFSVVVYEVDQPDLASFDALGNLLIKAAGSFNLRAEVIDPLTNQVLATTSIPVNNYIPLEPVLPDSSQATQAPPEVAVVDTATWEETDPTDLGLTEESTGLDPIQP